jgi:ABC-type multidrug transport system fused ATPase/permease subunit
MLAIGKKLYSLLTPTERKKAAILLGMILLMGFLDMVGVASIVPFMTVLANPSVVDANPTLAACKKFFGTQSPENFLFLLGVLVLLLLVTSIAFRAFTTYSIVRFTSMRNFGLSTRLVTGYLRQPYEWFLNRNSADLGKTILTEVDQVIRGAMLPLSQVIAGISISCFLISLLVFSNPQLALIVSAVLATAYGLIYIYLRPKLRLVGQERVQNNRLKYQIVSEAFGGIKEIKVRGLEESFREKFKHPAFRYANAEASHALAGQLPRYLLETIAFGGMLALALYLLKTKGSLENALPTMALYALAGYKLMPTLQQVYQGSVTLRYAEAAIDNLVEDLEAQTVLIPQAQKRSRDLELNECIELKDVCYSYPNSTRTTLQNLNLKIPALSTVGLVGFTGSGKTTTADLILGLLHPKSGQLCVDGKQIDDENRPNWQSQIGYVPQSIYLTDDTIAANIAFGIPSESIDLSAVERAATIANLHEFIVNNLPDKYQTFVGERGIRLSGGQRQRIGIARALYHSPKLLVLDEATSALDNLTEVAVMDAVNRLSTHLTIILIAHRLSTVQRCDRIYLLDSGRIAGQGTFDELVQTSPLFKQFAATAAK